MMNDVPSPGTTVLVVRVLFCGQQRHQVAPEDDALLRDRELRAAEGGHREGSLSRCGRWWPGGRCCAPAHEDPRHRPAGPRTEHGRALPCGQFLGLRRKI